MLQVASAKATLVVLHVLTAEQPSAPCQEPSKPQSRSQGILEHHQDTTLGTDSKEVLDGPQELLKHGEPVLVEDSSGGGLAVKGAGHSQPEEPHQS